MAKEQKKSGLVGLLAGLVIVVAIGVGAGFAGAQMLAPTENPEPVQKADAPAPTVAPVDIRLVPLSPIVTNLAHPSETWVRTELTLMSDAPLPTGDTERVEQDILAFLRTIRLDQVEGPSGFLTLREELDQRAAIRTEGRVKRVLIKALVFE